MAHILQGMGFLLILALVLGSSTLVFRFTEGFFLQVKKSLIAQVEAKTGSKVSYGGVSPSIFQSLELQDFVLYRKSDASRPFFRIRQLKVYFNLWAVVTNRPEEAIREISLENSSFSLDRTRDQDFLDMVQDLMEGPESDIPEIVISGKNLEVEYIDGDSRFQGSEVSFSLRPEDRWFFLNLEGQLSARGLPEGWVLDDLRTEVDIDGQFNRNFSSSQWEVGLKSFDSNLFSLSSQVFQLSLNGPDLRLTKIEDSVPLDLGLTYHTETGNLEFRFRGADLRIRDLLTLKGELAAYSPYLPSSITAGATVQRRDGKFRYSWDGNFRIQAPDPWGVLNVGGKWEGDDAAIRFTSLEAAGALGKMGFSGNFNLRNLRPSGLLSLREIRPLGGAPLDGLIRLRPLAGGSMEVYSERLSYGPLGTQSLLLTLLPEAQKLNLDLQLKLSGAKPGERNQLALAGLVDWSQGIAVRGTYSADGLSLAPWLESLALDLPQEYLEMVKTFSLFGSGTASWSSRGGWGADTSGLTLRSQEHPGRSLFLEAGVTQDAWDLKQMDLQWDDYRIKALSQGTYSRELDLAGGLTVDVGGLKYSLEGTYSVQKRSGEFTGSYGLKAQVAFTPEDSLSLAVTARDLPFSLGSQEGNLTFDVAGSFRSTLDWDLRMDEFQLKGPRLGPLENYTLGLAGEANPRFLDLRDLYYSDRWSSVKGRGLAEYDLAGGSQWRGQLLLSGTTGRERYSLVMDGQGTKYQGELEVTDFPLGRLGQESLRGTGGAAVVIRGDAWDWEMDGDVQIPDGRFNRDVFSVRGALTASPQEFFLGDGQLRYLGNSLSGISARINFTTGTARAESRYFGSFGKNLVTSKITLEANLQEKISLSSLQDIFSERVSGKVVLSETRNNNQSLEDFTLNFSRIKNSTTFRGGVGNFFQGRINDDGDFRIVLRDPFPVTFTAEGLLSLSSMDARFQDISLQVASLGEYLELPLVALKSGRVTGSLEVRGNPASPELFGTWMAQDLRITSDFLSQETQPLGLEVSFQGREVVLKESLVKAGNGEGKLSGKFRLEHWTVENFLVNLTIPPAKPLPVSYRLTGLDAEGAVSGSLKVEGNLFQAVLTGDLLVQDVNMAVGPQAEGVGPGDYGFGVDITLNTGRQVAFYWPSKDISIVKAYASPGQKLKILLDPNNGDFSLEGQIEIRGGDINLPTQSFFLKEGFIRFRENNAKFDPWLNVRGEQRRRDEKGNFTFLVLVDDFLSRFSPRFETSPSRSQEEILALVGDSILPGSEYSRLNLDTALSLASDVGTSYFLRPFEDAVKKTFSLDLFSLRTQVFKKALVANTSGNRLNFEDYLDNTSLFLGKYLGDLVFLEGLLTLEAETPLDGLSVTTLTPVLELGMEYETPFFLFNWRVTPANPRSLFIEDNQVSLIWRFTY